MSVKKFAAEMKATIEEIRANGTAAIYCDNIISYLDQVMNSPEPSPTPVDIERYKGQLQSWIDNNKHHHESELAMFNSVIAAGQSAIKSAFLLNGGAAFALLAFIAHLVQVDEAKVSDFSYCLLLFSLGTLTVVITSGLTYLSQWFYAEQYDWSEKVGFYLNIICIVLGFSSYVFFSWGLFATYCVFTAYG